MISDKLSKTTLNALILSTVLQAGAYAQGDEYKSDTYNGNGGQALVLKSLGNRDVETTLLVSFNKPLSRSEKERFYTMGVDTIVYAGALNYYFYLPESLIGRLHEVTDIEEIRSVNTQDRINQHHNEMNLATLSDDDVVEANVLFLKELSHQDLARYLSEHRIDAKIEKVTPESRSARVRLTTKAFKKMSKLPLVQYMDKASKLFQTDAMPLLEERNSKTSEASHVQPLWSDPYNLNGRNFSVGIVDGGAVLKTHREFGNRVYDRTSNGEVNFHATHVAGTIGAAGINPKAHGMANEVDVYSYYFGDDAFSDAVLNMYKRDGILFSNHSYGYSLKEHLADYDALAATQDDVVSQNPYLNIFEAAGNDGLDSAYSEYGIIKGPGNSKNVFTIGALNSMSNKVATLSSAGPVRDGRIKPDLCVRGEYVTSPTSEGDSAYAMMSGTSMACPGATGMGLLVAEEYKKVTGGYDIRHDTLKAVLINTATDVANPGPDYKAGFGMIDARAAVDTVKTIGGKYPLVNISTIGHGRENSYKFKMAKGSDFKVTIAWVDPEANPSSDITLVNDIDMVLVNETTGQHYYPYTLDKEHPSRVAQKNKANHVDNIEQIEVGYLPAGEYTLVVKGTKIITDTQEYSIASSLPIFSRSNIETLKPSKIQNFARRMFLATF
ncbi:MAG: hypothetical protein DSZ05_07650 [Sulfurospirillum sp.]|nr:MAG: hypothetical protein DSZ05_07650 [Sulfurospirillum sp.]